MSSFKIPPVYAEVLFDILDATHRVDGLKAYRVLDSFEWEFPGGAFGVREDPLPEGAVVVDDVCDVVIPGGSSKAMAKAMVDNAVARGDDETAFDFDPQMVPEMASIFRTRRLQRPMKVAASQTWAATYTYMVEDDRTVVAGMTAVYTIASLVFADCHLQNVYSTAEARFNTVCDLTHQLVTAASSGAEIDLGRAAENTEMYLLNLRKHRVPQLTVAEGYAKAVLVKMHGRAIDADLAELAEDVAEVDDIYEEYDDTYMPGFAMRSFMLGSIKLVVFPRAVVVRKGRKSYVLGVSDWRKVVILITGFKNYMMGTCADAATGPIASGFAATRAVNHTYMLFRAIVDCGAKLKNGRHLELAKMVKGVLSVAKARAAGERSNEHRAALTRDVMTADLYEVCKEPIDAMMSAVMGLKVRGALVVGKIFRLMPPPDVWMVRALRNRWEKASIVRTIAPEAIVEFKEALTEVILTARAHDKSVKLELRDKENPPGWWSDYLAKRIDRVPKSELADAVAWEGTVREVVRSRFDPSSWKDSALGMDTFDDAMSDEKLTIFKNMLVRMLYDCNCPMPDETLKAVQEISAVMLKPEGHKERIAYMNNLTSRMSQSRCEATVSSVMRSHPSFAPVKTGVERDNIFEEMSSPPPSGIEVPLTGIFSDTFWVLILYSFDITGWSENMPLDIQMASHEVWDTFTGGTSFSDTTANHNLATVYMNNAGVKAWYVNGGANFEGYNGKEMTALHIAIMTVAVKELRARMPDVPAAMLQILLQAYIDDGVARMQVPASIADRIFEVWEVVVRETWDKFGFKIEPKKSFPSFMYFEFLGEEFLAGRQLSSGSKAAMRITAEPFEAWETLPDRIAKITAACRGASTAGMNSLAAVMTQSVFSAIETSKWIRFTSRDATAAAFWMMAPRSLGGCSMPSLIPQSTNAVGAATEEGMANLREWALRTKCKSVRTAYCKLVKRGMAPRTAGEVLSSPLGGVSPEGVMTVSPLSHAVREGLGKAADRGELSDLGHVMIKLGDRIANAEFASAVITMAPGEVIQEAALKGVKDGTLEPVFAAFVTRFEKEATFLKVAGKPALRSVARKAKADAVASWDIMKGLVVPGAGMAVNRRTALVPSIISRYT